MKNSKTKTELILLFYFLLIFFCLLSERKQIREIPVVSHLSEVSSSRFLLYYHIDQCSYCAKTDGWVMQIRQSYRDADCPLFLAEESSSLWEGIEAVPLMILYESEQEVRRAEGISEIRILLQEVYHLSFSLEKEGTVIK